MAASRAEIDGTVLPERGEDCQDEWIDVLGDGPKLVFHQQTMSPGLKLSRGSRRLVTKATALGEGERGLGIVTGWLRTTLRGGIGGP